MKNKAVLAIGLSLSTLGYTAASHAELKTYNVSGVVDNVVYWNGSTIAYPGDEIQGTYTVDTSVPEDRRTINGYDNRWYFMDNGGIGFDLTVNGTQISNDPLDSCLTVNYSDGGYDLYSIQSHCGAMINGVNGGIGYTNITLDDPSGAILNGMDINSPMPSFNQWQHGRLHVDVAGFMIDATVTDYSEAAPQSDASPLEITPASGSKFYEMQTVYNGFSVGFMLNGVTEPGTLSPANAQIIINGWVVNNSSCFYTMDMYLSSGVWGAFCGGQQHMLHPGVNEVTVNVFLEDGTQVSESAEWTVISQ
ncbi:MAG: hypothetical protein N0E56_15735 [Candidatus Thiodiazotropha endolucinida]|nr:hypothetical protein [Candidatus Thiodiazotropha taylori]MCW4268074.1 hypothetical protein [Candidatus Thiodiazotropha endolucinida]